MRARHHRRTRHAAGTHAHHIADAVDRHGQPQFAHPLHDQVTSLPVGVGQRQTAHPTAVDRADLRQVRDAPEQAGAVDAHGRKAGLLRSASHAAASASASTSAALLPTMRW
ncbi:hypothetical protein D3C72_1719920 [compost metagenome]